MIKLEQANRIIEAIIKRGAELKLRPISAVVVLFPFVPVIAATGAFAKRNASSSSPITGTPRTFAASTASTLSTAIPGLMTINSAS